MEPVARGYVRNAGEGSLGIAVHLPVLWGTPHHVAEHSGLVLHQPTVTGLTRMVKLL